MIKLPEHITQYEIDNIIRDLKNGLPVKQIKNVYMITKNDIDSIIKEYSINYKPKRDTPQLCNTRSLIFADWQNGFTSIDLLCEKYGICELYARKLLRECGVKFERKKHKEREKTDKLKKIIEAVEQGKTSKEIKDELNLTSYSLSYYKIKYGMNIYRKHRTGEIAKIISQKLDEVNNDFVLLGFGWQSKLAREYEVSRQYINNELKKVLLQRGVK